MPITPPITEMIRFNPIELEISSVRNKKICVQDIFSQSHEDINKILPNYRTPNMVDLIKAGMYTAYVKDALEETKNLNQQASSKIQLDTLLDNINHAVVQNIGQTIGNLFSPPTVDVPIVSYTPYTGGVGGSFDYNPLVVASTMDEFKKANALLYNLIKAVRALNENITRYSIQLQTEIKDTKNNVIHGNKYVVDTINLLSKSMTKSLADYFKGLMESMIKKGCAYFPVGIVASLKISVINTTPVPQSIILSDLVVSSGKYILDKPNGMTIFAGPSETDNLSIPVVIDNVDAVDYIISKRGGGVIPITVSGFMTNGIQNAKVTYSNPSVYVR